MNSLTIAAALAVYASISATLAAETPFCYRDSEGCGPNTVAWSPLCHTGRRQSPINLPSNIKPFGLTQLRTIGSYKGNFFRVSNNGHSIAFDFVGNSGKNEGPTGGIFRFADPLSTQKPFHLQNIQNYRFASGHFHWGASSTKEGSEHCIGSRCYSMEMHLVHYSANYSSLDAAVASGKENALTVLGVFIDVGVLETIIGGIIRAGNPQLAPIIRNLNRIRSASHDGGWIRVNEPLDLTKLMNAGLGTQVYTYKGSLTTPGCNEQVNWFVLRSSAAIPLSDLNAFRYSLLDARGKPLDKNNRPILPINGRQVLLTPVFPTL